MSPKPEVVTTTTYNLLFEQGLENKKAESYLLDSRKKEVGGNSTKCRMFFKELNHDFGQKPSFASLRNGRLKRLDPSLNQF